MEPFKQETQQEIQQETPQVDVQKIINALLRQITESANKIAILEALLESKQKQPDMGLQAGYYTSTANWVNTMRISVIRNKV